MKKVPSKWLGEFVKINDLQRIETILGITFINKEYLTLALTHRSFNYKNNERLEFLGDSIVNLIISSFLYDRFPKAHEGQLTRLRASLVKGVTLAKIAKKLSLGDFILLGSGELKNGGFRRESTLADTLEAVIGGLYLDQGLEVCRQSVLEWFSSFLHNVSLEKSDDKDPKTRLQELLQANKKPLPLYQVVSISGDPHDQYFSVICQVDDLVSQGEGRSRRIAEQQAARHILIQMGVINQ